MSRSMFAYMFQDTNEAEADNTDKEGDFNLKVSTRRAYVRSRLYFHLLIVFIITSWTLEELHVKSAQHELSRFFYVYVRRRIGGAILGVFFFFIIAE